MDRRDIKEQELKYLAKEFKKNPELFLRETQVDDSQFLEKIGIFLPPQIQNNIAPGYLKLWPEDFIVEEVLKDGSIQTIDAIDNPKNAQTIDGQTVYATLVKCKLSTIEVVEEIASALNIEKQRIQFAGIKDKDAMTSQLISFRGLKKEDVEKVSSQYFYFKDVYCGKGVVEMGGLKGNKFTIFVRTNDSFNREGFLKNLELIKKEGFLNFFYSQRFGSPRFINWFWGLQIIKGEYEKAILSYLCSEGQREIPYFKVVRQEIKKHFGAWDKILEILQPFPLIMQNEIKVIIYLKAHPTDFMGALQQIPEQVKLWYFAYGSLLFNRKISQYLQAEKPLPDYLPIMISPNKEDSVLYKEFLEEDDVWNISLKNVRALNFIQTRSIKVKTKEFAHIESAEIIPEGVILSFELPKACYATTLLINLFELKMGLPPKDISENRVDAKKILEGNNIEETLSRFKEVIFSKSEDIFSKFE